MASALSEADGIDYTDPEEVQSVDTFSLIRWVLFSFLVRLLNAPNVVLYHGKLELLVATLIDLDAMDGKSSVSLLAECSSSPDVNTRYDDFDVYEKMGNCLNWIDCRYSMNLELL